jgi:hypothetical protein
MRFDPYASFARIGEGANFKAESEKMKLEQ